MLNEHIVSLAAPGGEKAAGDEAVRYRNRWLYTPSTVLAAVDPEPGVVLIRTKDTKVHRRVQDWSSFYFCYSVFALSSMPLLLKW